MVYFIKFIILLLLKFLKQSTSLLYIFCQTFNDLIRLNGFIFTYLILDIYFL